MGGIAVGTVSGIVIALLRSMSALRAGRGFDLASAALALVQPTTLGDWTTSVGLILVALLAGLGTAAVLVARQNGGSEPPPGE
jgi:hypothetical protein